MWLCKRKKEKSNQNYQKQANRGKQIMKYPKTVSAIKHSLHAYDTFSIFVFILKSQLTSKNDDFLLLLLQTL